MTGSDQAVDLGVPIKVLYVKPTIKRPPSAQPVANTPGMMVVEPNKVRMNRNNSETDSGFHNLANVSGIFKKKNKQSEKD